MTFQQFDALLEENPNLRTYNSQALANKLDLDLDTVKSYRKTITKSKNITQTTLPVFISNTTSIPLFDIPTEEDLYSTNYKIEVKEKPKSNVIPPIAPPGFRTSSFKEGNVWFKCDDSEEEIINSIDWKEQYREVMLGLSANLSSPSISNGNCLLVINATDVHLNKKYFQKSTTLADQINTFKTAVKYIVDKAVVQEKIEGILFQIGHDFFHSEYNKATTKGTPQDCLESPEVLFKEGLKAFIECIEYCKSKCQVDVVNTNGNHAYYAELQLISALEVFYEGKSNVRILKGQGERFYYQYYNNSFMLVHDYKKKLKDLPTVFSVECPDYFSTTQNRYILTGHYHSYAQNSFVTSKENYGIEHIQCPSLSGTDKWHHDNMYLGNKERMLGLILNQQQGIVNTIMYNKPYQDNISKQYLSFNK